MRRTLRVGTGVVTSNFLRDPDQKMTAREVLDAHTASGYDAPASLTQDFKQLQIYLFHYRVIRFIREWQCIRKNPRLVLGQTLSEAAVFVATILVAFCVGVVVGRGRIRGYVPPQDDPVAKAQSIAKK